tara:strand:- start:4183 stop:5337 length:1155 start_codon:yes stop_codon:yes gene_type:complete
MKLSVIVADIGPTAGGLYYSVRAMSAGASLLEGNQVEVFAMGELSHESQEHWAPVRPQVFTKKIPKAYGYAPRMQQSLRSFSPEIIHSHGIWMYNSMVAWRESQRTGAPLIVSPRGMLDPWAVQNSGLKKKLVGHLFEYRFLRDVTCFHALNESEAKSIREFGLKQPICIIPNGTDLPVKNSRKPCGDGLKRMLFIGRIHPKKGISNLIKAWGLLLKEQPELKQEWRLTIAGWEDGDYLAGYSSEAAVADCADSIEWPGSVYGEAKHELLSTSDAFVLPSFSEGLPMSVVEAWSYGLPVVMTPQCNLPEGFEYEAAVEIESTLEGTMAGLRVILDMNDAEREAMGRNGRSLVESHFTWDMQVKKMQSVYQWLVGEEGVPSCVNG